MNLELGEGLSFKNIQITKNKLQINFNKQYPNFKHRSSQVFHLVKANIPRSSFILTNVN